MSPYFNTAWRGWVFGGVVMAAEVELCRVAMRFCGGVMQLAIVYHPIGNVILRTAPLPLDWWWLMILFALPGFFVIEIEKWAMKRFRGRGAVAT